MPVRAEVQRRAEHLGRSMKAGLSPLWVIITAAVAVVGGSALLAALWGVRHLIWGLIILLVAAFAVLAEGSYRLSRSRGTEHAEHVKKLEQERDATRTELEDAQRAAISAPATSVPRALQPVYEQREPYRQPDEVGFMDEHRIGILNPLCNPPMISVRLEWTEMSLRPPVEGGYPSVVPPQPVPRLTGGDAGTGVPLPPGRAGIVGDCFHCDQAPTESCTSGRSARVPWAASGAACNGASTPVTDGDSPIAS